MKQNHLIRFSISEFPYYQERYGERGKRFSDSDTCWLVTLTNLNQESLQLAMQGSCHPRDALNYDGTNLKFSI